MARVRSQTWGDGPRHFLGIHGWGGGLQTFEPLLPHMPGGCRLTSFDLPGYGESAPLQSWRVEDLTAWLVELVDEIETPRLTLVGNCSGADFGLPLVRARPERFERLVLLDPFAFFPWYFKLLAAQGVGKLFYMTAFANPVGRWMTDRRLEKHRTDDSTLTGSFERLDHDTVYAYLRMLRQLPSYEEFADLSMPIDVCYGENTFGAVRESVKIWTDLWPQAVAHELPGAGHLPIQEATEPLTAVIFQRDAGPTR